MAEEFRIDIGGPLHRLRRAAHLEGLGRWLLLLILAAWAPLVLLTLAERIATGRTEPLVRDFSVHVRLLIALPLFAVGERVLARLVDETVRRLLDEGYVPPASEARVRALLGRVARWRDAAQPESLLLAVAFLAGLAALLNLLPPAGVIHGVSESHYSVVRIWYALFSLPLFQFLLWRSLFRWALWVRLLLGLSRVPLRLLPAHADRHAGIAFLKLPTLAYGSLMTLALSSVLCAGWGTQIVLYGARMETFRPLFGAYVLLAVVVAFAPLVAFVPQLARARLAGNREYGGLVADYTQRFHARWIARADRADLLGTPDIQSLTDLGTSYRENVEHMQVFLFAPRDWVLLLVASFIPAVPLMFLQGSTQEAIKRLLHILVGGLPG